MRNLLSRIRKWGCRHGIHNWVWNATHDGNIVNRNVCLNCGLTKEMG